MRILFICLFFTGCSTYYLKYDKEDKLRQNKEFENQVVVKEMPEAPTVTSSDATKVDIVIPVKKASVKKGKVVKGKVVKGKAAVAPVKDNTPHPREPTIESSEGFDFGSRRPQVDPFIVGEKVVHSIGYIGMEGGRITFEVKPFVEVNNRKSYNFYMGLKTSSMFSKIYSMDDYVETFIDYEDLVPHVFKLSLRESGKLLSSSAFFNNKTLKATFWEKKYTEKNGEEEKKLAWDILPYSQNVFSGIFYMRVFKWDIGKEISFRVADDEKNIVFKATAIKKLTLETDAGEFKAIKIKASVVTRGALTQAGDFYLWISDDDRKIILRIEAEIKVGKIVSEIVEYKSGI
ncbi:MAG: DUF3108 domain-containing protein [Bdellovibrionaceae bacterium]|nr:DUF3108 domain-containing protein [Pseudobdellovibrionaceae bacterium]